jgi:hypothetical protein
LGEKLISFKKYKKNAFKLGREKKGEKKKGRKKRGEIFYFF